MSFRGRIKDGKVVLDESTGLPEGADVFVFVVSRTPAPTPLAGLADLADSFSDDPDWPIDGAAEIDPYLYGTPKRGQ